MDKSVQQMLDEQMCKPGYTWNHTLKRCLAAGAPEMKEDVPPAPELEEDVVNFLHFLPVYSNLLRNYASYGCFLYTYIYIPSYPLYPIF